MAQRVILDREKLSCSICLDLLKDPVTIPCGHSYCMSCIKNCWDEANEKKTHSCPQCGQSFTPRPVMVKSTLLAELVEDVKKTGLQAASPDHSYAGPGDVACDFCSGMKLKAIKSCLVCKTSYCEQHLQPHYNVPPLKKHKLVEATLNLQHICSHHHMEMNIFCHNDQQCICILCLMDDRKGHNTVFATVEMTALEGWRQQIQQKVQDRENAIKVLQQRVEAINLSADEVVRDSEKTFTDLIHLIEKRSSAEVVRDSETTFTDLIHLIEKRSSEVKQQIRSQQKTHVSRDEKLEEKLQQEITELWRKDAELEQLSRTEDHLHFLNNYPSLSYLSVFKDLPSIDISPLHSFEDVTAAVSEARDKIQAVLRKWRKRSPAKPQAEFKTRAEFMKYSCQITLDPYTANTRVSLSGKNRKATLMATDVLYLYHPDRFDERWQVLSKEGLTGRCYWEVKWNGNISIAVAYKDISRSGTINECGFGNNRKSWTLECSRGSYKFRHNNISTYISGRLSSRIGVYLDHGAGTLSYYSISETMTLLHRVQTSFTQPLYAGFLLPVTAGDAAELCELKKTGVGIVSRVVLSTKF